MLNHYLEMYTTTGTKTDCNVMLLFIYQMEIMD